MPPMPIRLVSQRVVSENSSLHVSIVIVNYNAGDLLTKTVLAALSSSVPVEVFVSDNGSTDGSLFWLRQRVQDTRLHIIENHANLGFARANNIALKRATGEFVLLLNPDCLIQPGTLQRLLAAMSEHPQAMMAGCLIRNPNGTEQAGCRRRVPSPWRTLVRVLHLNKLFPRSLHFPQMTLRHEPLPNAPVVVEAISGAFMFIRHAALQQVGLLDEHYFLHCEDLDLCMQFQRRNWPILFVPDVEVIHYKGTCSANRPIRVLWHKHNGMVRFYRKFFRHQYPLVLMVLVNMAVWLRFALLALGALVKMPVRLFKLNPVSSISSSTSLSTLAPPVLPHGDTGAEDPVISGLVISSGKTSIHESSR